MAEKKLRKEQIESLEGTDILSTGETGAVKFLREDGDGTCSWQSPPTVGTVDVVSNVATSTILGRVTAGSGDSEELTATQVRTLINVEDGADVTDTTNVTAAGAVMDSEVTNLAQVKAFDSSDYAPALGADDNYVTDAEKVVIGNTSGTNTGDETAASLADVNGGTVTGEYIDPDTLAGSYAGTKSVAVMVQAVGEDLATGDGLAYVMIPAELDGMNLIDVKAGVDGAGTTGTTDFQIHNFTDSVDMLSTKLTIDSGETTSETAATAAVINTSNDDVAEGDILRIDCDAVSTTAPTGGFLTLTFRKA